MKTALLLVGFYFICLSAEASEAELSVAAKLIIEKTNDFRKEHKLTKVEPDTHLQKAAQEFANFMAKTSKYGHEADGKTPAARAQAAGYEYCVVRENIAYRTDSTKMDAAKLAEHFTQGWIDSPHHRENMLGPHITQTGVAIASVDELTFYAVQMFGRPKSLTFEVLVVNPNADKHLIKIVSDNGTDEIEVPAKSRLKLKRCYPTTLFLDDSTVGKLVSEAIELTIRDTESGSKFE